MDGKAMIVCMSRRICVELYKELVRLRPELVRRRRHQGSDQNRHDRSSHGSPDWQQHIRTKNRRDALGNRFRNTDDQFRIVLVRDMWLTGFDAPSLHTMYLDKPMQGHGLFQAITRVNRSSRTSPRLVVTTSASPTT